MNKKKKVVVLYGGKSGEHEVSLCSCASVLRALDKDKYDIQPVGIDKEGRFYQTPLSVLLAKDEDAVAVKLPESTELNSLIDNGKFYTQADVVFPVVHGPLYEDGCLQGLLELCNIAYVGCNPLASAISMDKDIAKRLVTGVGLNTAKHKVIANHASASQRKNFAKSVLAEFGSPVFVKPVCLGSSVGIHKAANIEQLCLAIDDALHYDNSVLVEECITGKEIELAVLENSEPGEKPLVSVAGEIKVKHDDGYYSYAAKYQDPEKTELLIPAQITEQQLKDAQAMAATIFEHLKCHGMARVDLFATEKGLFFNELNTIPGFTKISMYPKLWQASGIHYGELLDKLITLSIRRHTHKQRLVTSYQ